jgi:hypothetical protein
VGHPTPDRRGEQERVTAALQRYLELVRDAGFAAIEARNDLLREANTTIPEVGDTTEAIAEASAAVVDALGMEIRLLEQGRAPACQAGYGLCWRAIRCAHRESGPSVLMYSSMFPKNLAI